MEANGHGLPQSSYQVIQFKGSELAPEYDSFVRAKFKLSLRHGNEYLKLTDSDAYFAAQERYVNILLARPRAVLRLATLTDDKDVLLGFSLIEEASLHYVFVQYEYRNMKIGTALVPHFDRFTNLTRTGMRIWQSKYKTAQFNPWS